MSVLGRVKQWNTFTRVWHLFDAKWQDPFQSAVIIQKYLNGLHKPIYHPLADCGDHVVVINSKEIALRGDEWRKRAYYHHTGYPKGASYTLAWELHDKDPTIILKKAIYKAMKNNLQRRTTMQRLHIFEGDNLPDDIRENLSSVIRRIRPVPIRLDTYTEEEIEKFPKIWDYPKDFIVR